MTGFLTQRYFRNECVTIVILDMDSGIDTGIWFDAKAIVHILDCCCSNDIQAALDEFVDFEFRRTMYELMENRSDMSNGDTFLSMRGIKELCVMAKCLRLVKSLCTWLRSTRKWIKIHPIQQHSSAKASTSLSLQIRTNDRCFCDDINKYDFLLRDVWLTQRIKSVAPMLKT